MTFEEKIKGLLVSDGLADNEANDVIERIKASEENKATECHWNEPIDWYPPVMLAAMYLITRRHTIEYIDENPALDRLRPIFAN